MQYAAPGLPLTALSRVGPTAWVSNAAASDTPAGTVNGVPSNSIRTWWLAGCRRRNNASVGISHLAFAVETSEVERRCRRLVGLPGNPWRQTQRMRCGQGHTAVAADDKGSGAVMRRLVNRITISAEHA